MKRTPCPAELIDALAGATRVSVTAHERPDGDAVGAAVGLARILRRRGTDARVIGLEPFPRRYAFLLDGDDILADGGAEETDDLAIVLDSGALDRAPAGEAAARAGLPVVDIDHHPSNPKYGDRNWIDPAASSSAEMIERLARQAGWNIPPEAATALWTGLVTDTGRFGYDNADAEAFACATRLLDDGVVPAEVNRAVFQRVPLGELRLTALAVERLRTARDGKVAWIVLSFEDFADLGLDPAADRDLVDIPRDLEGVVVAFCLYGLESGKTKISIRSPEPFDAVVPAKRFGGGGHARAAGATIDAPPAEAEKLLLAECDALWGEELDRLERSPDCSCIAKGERP